MVDAFTKYLNAIIDVR